MQRTTHLLYSCALVAALLPVTAWGYGFYDYHADRSYRPSTGRAVGSHHSSRMNIQTGRSADGYYIRVYLDGIRPEDLQVTPRRNRLILEIAQGGRHGPDIDGRSASRWQMRMRKVLRLPPDADWTRLTTTTSNGIMEIHIPGRRQNPSTDPSPAQ